MASTIQGGNKKCVTFQHYTFSKMVKDTKVKLSHFKENRLTNWLYDTQFVEKFQSK